MRHDGSHAEAWGKATAGFTGASFVALAFLVVAGGLPMGPGTDSYWGLQLGVWFASPVWAGVVLAALVSQDSRRAWTVVGVTTVVSAAAALLVLVA